jgi:hypothetical protein
MYKHVIRCVLNLARFIGRRQNRYIRTAVATKNSVRLAALKEASDSFSSHGMISLTCYLGPITEIINGDAMVMISARASRKQDAFSE